MLVLLALVVYDVDKEYNGGGLDDIKGTERNRIKGWATNDQVVDREGAHKYYKDNEPQDKLLSKALFGDASQLVLSEDIQERKGNNWQVK